MCLTHGIAMPCCTRLWLLLLTVSSGILHLSTNEITHLPTQQFDTEIIQFLNEVSGIEVLQKAYDRAVSAGTMTFEEVEHKSLVEEVAESLSKLLQSKVEALKAAVTRAEHLVETYAWDEEKPTEVDYIHANAIPKDFNESIYNFEFNEQYRQNIDLENSSVHIPIEIYKKDDDILRTIGWTSGLDQVWKDNKKNDSNLVWQYFGSQTGALRTFPASRWRNISEVDLYDVRRSPWYTQGASSPKDMLILIDRSGSAHGQALALIKHSVRSIIDTLGENDFVNVVQFSNEPNFLECFHCFLQATAWNKKKLLARLDNMKAGQVADYSKGFEFAFKQFINHSVNTNCGSGERADCNPVIMLFTDGGAEVPTKVLEDYNKNKKIRIFTFAVGPIVASAPTAPNEIACSNRGVAYQIPSMSAIQSKVQDYLNYLSHGISANETLEALWSSVSEDIWGVGLVISATMPVFNTSQDTVNRTIIGVMGLDVAIDELMEALPSDKLWPTGYAFALNSNGIVLFHPDLKSDGLNPVVDFADMEEETPERERIRTDMIDGVPGTVKIFDFVTGLDDHHADKQKRTYYYTGIRGTNFSVAVVLPDYIKYAVKSTRYIDPEKVKHLLLTNDSAIISKYKYCRLANTTDLYMQDLNTTEAPENPTFENCDDDLAQRFLFDVLVTSSLEEKWKFGTVISKQEQESYETTVVSDELTSEPLITKQEQESNETTDVSSDGVEHNATSEPLITKQQQDSTETTDVSDGVEHEATSEPLITKQQQESTETDVRDRVEHQATSEPLITKQQQESTETNVHDGVEHQATSEPLITKQQLESTETNDVSDGVKSNSTHNLYSTSDHTIHKRNAPIIRDGVIAQFVVTRNDFRRVYPANQSGLFDDDKFLQQIKVLNKRSVDKDLWIFSTYPEQIPENYTGILVTATKAVSLKSNNYKAAVIGVQLTLEKFHELLFDTGANQCNSSDVISCYILDDGGFILASDEDNFENIAGKFLGEVDGELMHGLVNNSIYENHVKRDIQATCERDNSKSAGFRVIPPFFYEILSFNWWTTASTWSYLNVMNIYSWLFAQIPDVAAKTEIHNESCIKDFQQYRLNISSDAVSGEINCDNCTRKYVALPVKGTNLLMVSVDGESCNCFEAKVPYGFEEFVEEMPESNKVKCNATLRYRKRPPCYDNNPFGFFESHCGASSTSCLYQTIVTCFILAKLIHFMQQYGS